MPTNNKKKAIIAISIIALVIVSVIVYFGTQNLLSPLEQPPPDISNVQLLEYEADWTKEYYGSRFVKFEGESELGRMVEIYTVHCLINA